MVQLTAYELVSGTHSKWNDGISGNITEYRPIEGTQNPLEAVNEQASGAQCVLV
jgi:hypothetical protein